MLYVVLGVLVFGGYQLYNSQIKAVDPSQEADTGFLVDTSNTNTVDLYLKKDGYLYSGKRRISNAEYFTSGDVYQKT